MINFHYCHVFILNIARLFHTCVNTFISNCLYAYINMRVNKFSIVCYNFSIVFHAFSIHEFNLCYIVCVSFLYVSFHNLTLPLLFFYLIYLFCILLSSLFICIFFYLYFGFILQLLSAVACIAQVFIYL